MEAYQIKIRPRQKRYDPYLDYLQSLEEQDAVAQQKAGGGGAMSGIAGIAETLNEAGVFGESASTAGTAAATGGMSAAPSVDLATIKSLSTGGSGLQTAAPAQLQSISSPVAPVSGWSLEGVGSQGNYLLPVAGAIGAYDLFKNKRRGARGVAQGAASGAAMGSYFGPVGTGVGAGIGLVAGLLQARKSTKEKQKDRWDRTSRSDLADSMSKYDYGTNNEMFRKTRDEKYLTANDIRVNPDNYNNVADWDNWNPKQQDIFLNDLLKNNKVREKKGGIYYDDQYATDLANKIRNGQYGK